MHIKVYDTVPARESVLRAIQFGLDHIRLADSPYLDPDQITIRVYSLGHPTAKGTSTLIQRRAIVSIYTACCSSLDDIYETIFHELTHLKQFHDRDMLRVDYHEAEPEAEDQAHVMLKKFLDSEEKRALQDQL